MNTDNYVIRRMKNEDEVKYAIKLARTEGWNPGIHDAKTFFTADPNGFLIGLLNGHPISCISAIKYNENFGFLGLYIVEKKFRNQHFGIQIWNVALKYLEGCDIGLDGVETMVSEYMQSGFETAYFNTRYEGVSTLENKLNPKIIELSNNNFSDLFEYDESIYPAPRQAFLRGWINSPSSISLGYLDNKKLLGYGVIRKCVEGYKIGPLFADNENIAESLFQALSNQIQVGEKIFLDIPGEKENPEALKLVFRHKMDKVFKSARMYRMTKNTKLNLPLHRWYGITSFELG